MALERVSIKELSTKMGFKDARTTYRWCEKNGLIVYSDGRLRFVLNKELDMALDGAIIDKLKQLYTDNWKEKYENLNTGEKKLLPIKMEATKIIPVAGTESDFLKKLKKIATDERNRIS